MTVVGVATAQTATAAPAPTGTAGAGTDPTGPPRTVTLITGDRVTVNERAGQLPAISITPGPGRDGIRFQRNRDKSGWSVYPSDALPMITSGVLDRQLFRIDRLLADGYDDSRPTLPLIVEREPQLAAAALPGATSTRQLPSIGATAMAEQKDKAGEFWSSVAGPRAAQGGVRRIWLDAKVRANLDQSVPQIGAPTAWKNGYTGKDVKVAVLDTGVDATHPDLTGKLAGAKDFSGGDDPTDHHGHGTHVASTILGSGAASGGKYKGVAPDARLLAAKVLNDDGSGGYSGIVSGMEWAVEQGAKVVNLSLGATDTEDIDPLEAAVNRLSADKGVLFVVAAGNDGELGASTIGSPGSAGAALTVGAVDRADKLAYFSSRGPGKYDNAVKPEITAPGVGIVAARAAGVPANNPVGDHYQASSGTSMATPHVAGSVALLAQQHPDWPGDRLKAALTGTAKPTDGLTAFQQGAGRVDAARVTTQQVDANVSTVGFGSLPSEATPKPVTRELVYRNTGTAPVDLDLRLDVRDAEGKPAADGLITVSSPRVTVPAGGTASVTVTLDQGTRPRGAYGGTLIATSANGASVRTLISADLQRPQYDVNVKLLGREPGKAGGMVFITNLDTGLSKHYYITDGGGEVRMAQGRYLFMAEIHEMRDGDRIHPTLVAAPGTVIDTNKDVVLDGRGAKPVTVHTDRSDARSSGELVDFVEQVASGGTISHGWWQTRIFNDTNYAYVAPTTTNVPDFSFLVVTQLGKQNKEGRTENSPYLYNLRFPSKGRVPDVSAYRVRDHELARVSANYASTGSKQWGKLRTLPSPYANEDDLNDTWWFTSAVQLPTAREEFYSAGDLTWFKRLQVDNTSSNGNYSEMYEYRPSVRYQPGKQYQEGWNRAVAGPSLKYLTNTVREGDSLSIQLPVFAVNADEGTSVGAAAGRTRLLRDGKEIASVPRVPHFHFPDGGPVDFTVPTEAGEYTLIVEAKRQSDSTIELSNEVTTSWRFKSSHVEGKAVLPLMAVRAKPALGKDNDARRLLPTEVPLEVERPAGVTGDVRRVSAAASFDGGRTWHDQFVFRDGQQWRAFVWAPLFSPSSTVSLRLSAQDSAGNAVTQTMMNAYRLR
nr:S8 family serine peptidase [Kibdelosporangium sp. MJ126-NF4]